MNNLWGELPEAQEIRSPGEILQEQAAILSQSTRNVLVGKIDRRRGTEGRIMIDLDVVAPALDNYLVTVLTVIHKVFFYPLTLASEFGDRRTVSCEDEETFLEELGAILKSPNVHKVIASLLSQSRASAKAEGEPVDGAGG